MGWSRNLVSKRKYHMIIPELSLWNDPLEEGALDSQTHLLHGLLHCNGLGHLVCINGVEGGSKYVCGREVMDLWDRICTILGTRKVTVEDVSKKKGVELRLLHGIAYGNSWFGRWNYRFCRGNFGVSFHNYSKAVEVLSGLNLNTLLYDLSHTATLHRLVKQMISHYRSKSDGHLLTLRDLLKFMLSTLKYPNNNNKYCSQKLTISNVGKKRQQLNRCRNFSSAIANMDSRWPARRLEFAADVIVEALKEKRGGMTRQEVRDAARLHIGDTGLLDYVLKSMNNVVVRNYIVKRSVNSLNRVLEYTIQEAKTEQEQSDEERVVVGHDVYEDIACICNKVLMGYPEEKMAGLAARVILDSKHFIKEWPLKGEEEQLLHFIFRVRVGRGGGEEEEATPAEHIVLPLYASLGELKEAGEEAVRDTYCVMEKYVVTEVEGAAGMEDGEVIFGAVECGGEVWGRGYGAEMEGRVVYEGGVDNWTVKCECGAGDDDGERMVCCDVCDVWQHTRCMGIEDADPAPPFFVCNSCSASLLPSTSDHHLFLQLPHPIFASSSSF